MHDTLKLSFDPAAFLASAGLGRRIVQLKPKKVFFAQGGSCETIFYLQKGREERKPRSHF